MLGNFPTWNRSKQDAVHFISTIPSGCLLVEREREKCNDRAPRRRNRVFSTGVLKLKLSGWQRVATSSQPYTHTHMHTHTRTHMH